MTDADPPADRDAVVERLIELERQFMAAVQGRDLDELERTVGEEFTLTTGRPGVEVRERQDWLDITKDHYVVEAFGFDWFAVQVHGHVGVVRSRYHQRAWMGTEDRSTAYLMTDVWVKREPRWQIVTRHISPLS